MVMKVNNKVETNRKDKKKKMSPLKDADDVCVEYLVDREEHMVKRELNIHVNMNDSEGQSENIFHIRCHVHNKYVA
jgi:hypothetical protein